MDARIETNRLRWDEMAALHVATYDIDAVDAAGAGDSLKPFELEELGDVRSQRICHLQCHLGGDSLALARLGTTVVGVDFSPASIEIARYRAQRTGLSDRVSFICATVDEAPQAAGDQFDGVYTSWGVLCWLPSVENWACAVGQLLKADGWLYLADTHPYATALRSRGVPYGGAVASFDESQGDYTSDGARFDHPQSWQWSHGLGEIVSALVGAGLQLAWLREHLDLPWHLNDKEHLREGADRMWREPGSSLPLSFSLRATKTTR